MEGPPRLIVPTRLASALKPFGTCFASPRTRRHLAILVAGFLSTLPRKSARAIAQAFGVMPRTLERFLSSSRWDPAMLRDGLQRSIAREDCHSVPIALMVDAQIPKQRGQNPATHWLRDEARSRRARGISTVQLGYSCGNRVGFLDGDVYVPKCGGLYAEGLEGYGLPPYRPRWEIALEQLDIARGNGLIPDWITCGKAYLESRDFFDGLAARGQRMLGNFPSTVRSWILDPGGVEGREKLSYERFMEFVQESPLEAYSWAHSLGHQLDNHPALRFQWWETCRVEDGNGTMQDWSVGRVPCVLMGTRHWIGPLELVVYRPATTWFGAHFTVTTDASATSESIVDAAERTRRAAWELDAMWTGLGMGHFSGRSYSGQRRHWALGAVASWLRPLVPRKGKTIEIPVPVRYRFSSACVPTPDPSS